RRDSCGEPRASPAQPPADPESALYAPLIVSHEGAAQRGSGERPEPPPARRQASESPDNVVVQLPGTARACTPRSSCAQRRKIPGEGDDQATTDPRPVP